MDDIAAYFPPPGHQYTYYQQPPPPGASHPPLTTVPQLQNHHLPPPLYQPAPAFAPYAPPLYQPSFQDEVRTLFIAGLPDDVKPREIYNLFREFPGYESSHLRNPTTQTQPFGFAVFLDQPSALAALHSLNGMVFDLEKGSTLHIDLAKSNSRSKRSRDDERHGSDKRSKGSVAFSRGTSDTGVGSIHVPGMGNSAYNKIDYPTAQSHGSFEGRAESATASKSRNSSAPPCPTIFVANLGANCSEEELIQVFSRCRGFLKLKMQSTYGTPVAFVDFQDTACSTEALNHLQGTILYSSTGGEGMRLEYAKSRMGMRSKKSR